MDKKQFYARAKEIFAQHSKEDKIFFTSDGQGFFQKHFADAHAPTLKDKEVAEVTREDLERADSKTPATVDEQPETIKHVVTQEDLDANPELAENGVKVGDEIELPAKSDVPVELTKEQKAAEALQKALDTPEAERTSHQKGLITKANKANQ